MALSRFLRRLRSLSGIRISAVVALIAAAGLGAWVLGGASATPPPAGTDHVVVSVTDSNGNPLAGVTINYRCDSGPYDQFGITDSSGGVSGYLTDGYSCSFTAIYRGTHATEDDVAITGPPHTAHVQFQTSAVTVTLTDHTGTGPLAGGAVAYNSCNAGSGTWLNPNSQSVSTTDFTGAVTGQLFNGTYDFHMTYNHGTECMPNVSVNGATTVAFQTGLLSIVYRNPAIPDAYDLSYGGTTGDSAFFTKSGTELLPDTTYNLHPRGLGTSTTPGCRPISITLPKAFAGTSATKTILAAQLIDSSGNRLSDGTFDYYAYPGGWHYSVGTTDSSGAACAVVDGALGSNISVAMHYQGTRQQKGPQNVATDSVFNFQTTDVTVQLENHLGSLIDTGSVSYYAFGWYAIGNTSGGQVHVEMLPGSYSFAMLYNGRREQRDSVSISGSSTAVTFQTALVELHFSGTTQYIALLPTAVWTSFSSPSEMLPVATTYGFSGPGHAREQLTFTPTAGTVFEKTILYTTVKASDGSAVSAVPAVWWNYGGSTSPSSTTNSNGHVLFAVDGAPTNTNVQITYGGANSSLMFQNPQTNSFYDFQLVKVTVQLEDNTGSIISDATPAVTYHYYGASEAAFGTMSSGSVSLDLLPASNTYFFTISNYNGGAETVSQHVTGTATVVFQTGKVVDGGYNITNYHQYGKPNYTFTSPMQLLPGNYYFNGTALNAQVYAGQTLTIASDGSTSYTTP